MLLFTSDSTIQTLSLNRPYQDLRSNFSKNIKRNIKTAEQFGLSISQVDSKDFASYYLKHSDKANIQKTKLDSFLQPLIETILSHAHGELWGVKNEQGQILAACLLCKFNGRLTYLLARSSEEGKKKSAMHFVLDSIIKQYAGKDFLLDFEGSDIATVARFFKSFGANNSPYPVLSYARFPFKKTESKLS